MHVAQNDPPRATPDDLIRQVEDPNMTYWLHRGTQLREHTSMPHTACWCTPMPINLITILAHTPTSLQKVLDAFYAVN